MSAQKNILSVGYDTSLLALRQSVLQQAGYAVVKAGNVAAAMGLYSSRKFDMVLLGHTVPKKERNALAREFRTTNPEIALVMLKSRYGQDNWPAGAKRGRSEGPDTLLHTIDKLFKNRVRG